MGRKEFNRKQLAQLIFLLSGISLIFLAYILELKGFQLSYDVAKDLSVAFLAFVILDILWSSLVHKEAPSLEGIAKVYLDVREAGRDISWIDLVKQANYRIDLQGLSLSFQATDDEFMHALKQKIISGVRVRVVLMSPDHPLLGEEIKLRSFVYPEDIKNLSKTSAERFKNLERELEGIKGKKGSLTLILNDSRPMSVSVRRFDDKMYVLHYEWHTKTVDTPVYLMKGEEKPLFKRYLDAFEDQFTELLIAAKAVSHG